MDFIYLLTFFIYKSIFIPILLNNEEIMDYPRAIQIGMAHKGIKNQKALSKLTGVSENVLSRIMSGNGDPSIETVEKISIGMGYLVSEFSALGE